MATEHLERLFAPGKIGTMALRNRIVMSPMVDNLGTPEGYVSREQVGYYEARARGGAAMVTVGASAIDFPRGKGLARNLAVDDDKYLPGLSELAGAIKLHGARAAIQLHHAGREAKRTLTAQKPVAPSAIEAPLTIWGAPHRIEVPHELTVAEIQEIVAQFADAVARCKRAGFDGVELHANSAYLIDQFLSAASNRRTDDYGGSLENRARFLVEIIQACKEKVGKGYPLWCRLTVREYGIDGCIQTEEAKRFAALAEQAGIDAINTSVFVYEQTPKLPPHSAERPGFLVRFAQAIKEAVAIPVIAAGRIDPALGEEVLKSGKADFIGIGRGLIADPELPQKAAAGRCEDIVPCISCFVCLDRVTKRGVPVQCTVNPRVGKELEHVIEPAAPAKNVLVIGAGPAGLQAGIVAAARGHRVTLVESGDRPGGVMVIGAIPPHKPHLPAFTAYLIRQAEKAGVRMVLGQRADERTVNELEPDVVVLAAGARPKIPPIPGLAEAGVLFPADVLQSVERAGKNVCIIGGGDVGCEIAEYLADEGRQVTIVELLPEVAADMPFGLGSLIRARLAEKGVAVFAGARCQQVAPGLVSLLSVDGTARSIVTDSIVVAAGGRPRDDLAPALRGKVDSVHLVGDCAGVGTIRDAVVSAYDVAVSI